MSSYHFIGYSSADALDIALRLCDALLADARKAAASERRNKISNLKGRISRIK